jgi:hypothetical protein
MPAFMRLRFCVPPVSACIVSNITWALVYTACHQLPVYLPWMLCMCFQCVLCQIAVCCYSPITHSPMSSELPTGTKHQHKEVDLSDGGRVHT